tara:strand:- start:1526 stop:1660 length:135 start_codon:yes stop_codon:yes gene_type:complete
MRLNTALFNLRTGSLASYWKTPPLLWQSSMRHHAVVDNNICMAV